MFVTGAAARVPRRAASGCARCALELLCPGHGDAGRAIPTAKLDEYLAHRAERERKLLAALERGLRDEDELLDAAWADAPPALRGAAGLSLEAHLGKLHEEGRLPDGIELR